MAWQKEEWGVVLGVQTAEISGSKGMSILILFETSKGPSKNVVIIYIPTNSV